MPGGRQNAPSERALPLPPDSSGPRQREVGLAIIDVFGRSWALRALRQSIEGRMFVRERPGEGPPLLFVHGLGESGLCFEGLLDEPSLAGHRLLAPDLPGYGRSAWSEEPLALARQADGVADWLGRRGEDRVVVIGHSMGGVVALLLAERHPRRVAAVVDVEGNKSPGDCVFSGRAAAQELEEFVVGGFELLRDEVYRQGVEDEAFRGYYASLRLCDPRAFHLNSLELVELSATETLARRLAGLAVPACYVAGAPDGASPRSRELLAEAGVRRFEVRPSGHWPFLDRPGDFIAALQEFLAGLGS